MVLHPLAVDSRAAEVSAAAENTSFVPAWHAVEKMQKQAAQAWLLITQPDHAQLAGDLAARLHPSLVPKLSSEALRAIAVHDAGWADFDSGLGPDNSQNARVFTPKLNDRGKPISFIEVSPADFVVAWTGSIQLAEAAGPTGGIIVSRHFCRLAEGRLDSRIDDEEDTSRLRHFLHHEAERQGRLLDASNCSPAKLDLLTDVLQFCDLLSLYLCCGAQQAVEFPQEFAGVKIRARRDADMFHFEPAVFGTGASLGVVGTIFPSAGATTSRSLAFLLQ